jgi:hypothetical protein
MHSSSHKRTITSTTVTIAIVAAMASLGVLVVAVSFTVQPAYAQLVKDPGASGFAPGEEPKRPGWDPNGAPEDAPGHCIGCAEDSAPGQEGLKAGIIGPD